MLSDRTDLDRIDNAVTSVEEVAAMLGVVEEIVERLPTDAFADDRLYSRAQALVEVLEAGLSSVPGVTRLHGAGPPARDLVVVLPPPDPPQERRRA